MKHKKYWISLLFCLIFIAINTAAFTSEKTNLIQYGKGYRFEENGWIFVHIEGDPYERGYQHGYLAAEELREILRTAQFIIPFNTGMEWQFFVDAADRLFTKFIDPEIDIEVARKILADHYDVYASELLNDKGLALGIYDARVTIPGTYVDEDDPSYFLIGGPFKSCLAHYLKNDLQFESNLSYFSGSAEVYEKWNWESGRPIPRYEGTVSLGYPNQCEELSKALRRSDFLNVFIASGVYDLECPYDSVLYSINHLDLPAERRNNITLRLYPGGHMLYTNPEALAQLKKDLEIFYQDILGE